MYKQHAQLATGKTQPRRPFWRCVLAESSKSEDSVLHRDFKILKTVSKP
jgi:hypothetical protein